MALTEINSKGIKDGEIVNADIADDTIAEAKLDSVTITVKEKGSVAQPKHVFI